MRREWLNAEQNVSYYFFRHSGRIVGQAFNFVHTRIWGAKIPVSATEELILGQYVTLEFAKEAIVDYWDGKDRTINYTTQGLITHHEA